MLAPNLHETYTDALARRLPFTLDKSGVLGLWTGFRRRGFRAFGIYAGVFVGFGGTLERQPQRGGQFALWRALAQLLGSESIAQGAAAGARDGQPGALEGRLHLAVDGGLVQRLALQGG